LGHGGNTVPAHDGGENVKGIELNASNCLLSPNRTDHVRRRSPDRRKHGHTYLLAGLHHQFGDLQARRHWASNKRFAGNGGEQGRQDAYSESKARYEILHVSKKLGFSRSDVQRTAGGNNHLLIFFFFGGGGGGGGGGRGGEGGCGDGGGGRGEGWEGGGGEGGGGGRRGTGGVGGGGGGGAGEME